MRLKRFAAFIPIVLVGAGLVYGPAAVGALSPAKATHTARPHLSRTPADAQTGAALTLKVSRAGNGDGSVTSRPVGIDCPSTCSHSFASGQVVRLHAEAEDGSVFAGWAGGCTKGSNRAQAYVSPRCSVAMGKARAIKATFKSSTKALKVKLAGSAAGTVKSQPAGISCGKDCKHAFAEGKVIKLTASPAAGAVFVGWKASCAVKSNRQKAYLSRTCTITMAKTRVAIAKFKGGKKHSTAKKPKHAKKKHKKHKKRKH